MTNRCFPPIRAKWILPHLSLNLRGTITLHRKIGRKLNRTGRVAAIMKEDLWPIRGWGGCIVLFCLVRTYAWKHEAIREISRPDGYGFFESFCKFDSQQINGKGIPSVRFKPFQSGRRFSLQMIVYSTKMKTFELLEELYVFPQL